MDNTRNLYNYYLNINILYCRVFNSNDNESNSQMDAGRRQRFNKASLGNGGTVGMRNMENQNNAGPFFVTSPLNKTKQDVFN